jgi:hypothetical protein
LKRKKKRSVAGRKRRMSANVSTRLSRQNASNLNSKKLKCSVSVQGTRGLRPRIVWRKREHNALSLRKTRLDGEPRRMRIEDLRLNGDSKKKMMTIDH